MEDQCLQDMNIVHDHANDCFNWLSSRHQSVDPSREAISVLFEKYKRFTSVHPVETMYFLNENQPQIRNGKVMIHDARTPFLHLFGTLVVIGERIAAAMSSALFCGLLYHSSLT